MPRRFVFVVDSTASMTHYLSSLLPTLEELLHIFKLMAVDGGRDGAIDTGFEIGILAYVDYCDRSGPWVTKWSGWSHNLHDFIASLKPTGNLDTPEAAKTAAYCLTNHLVEARATQAALAAAAAGTAVGEQPRPDDETVVFWYADAEPHSDFFRGSDAGNLAKERQALGESFEWAGLCAGLASAGARVYPLIPSAGSRQAKVFFTMMAGITGGKAIALTDTSARSIGVTTVNLVLTLMGQQGVVFDHAQMMAFADYTLTAESSEADLVRLVYAEAKPAETTPITLDTFPAQAPGTSSAARFKADPAYKSLVYSVFGALITQHHITSLTYNAMFASLWRAVCNDRGDERRQGLLDAFSSIIPRLASPADQATMQEFLAESYNQGEEVRRLIEEGLGSQARFPAIALLAETETSLTAKEVLELFRSCSPDALQSLAAIMTNMQLLTADPAAGITAPGSEAGEQRQRAMEVIPLNLPDRDFFSVLLHLAKPGILLALRSAVVLAMLAVHTQSQPLLAKALGLLASTQGQWLSREAPENFSYAFVKFALRVHEASGQVLLTEHEAAEFRHLHKLGGLKINAQTALKTTQAFTSQKTVRADHKLACKRCGELRSFTLMDARGTCGLCLSDAAPTPCTDPQRSCWCECYTCKVHYVVERSGLLLCRPKCHFCRAKGEPAPSIECSACGNRFVNCVGVKGANGTWRCPPCSDATEGAPADAVVGVPVRKWLANDPILAQELGVAGLSDKLFDRSLWETSRDCGPGSAPADPVNRSEPQQIQTQIQIAGKVVKNVEEVRAEVRRWIELERAELGCCAICFNDMPKHACRRVCGRRRCTMLACDGCLSRWYGEPKPGANLPLSNLDCPFCKQRPAAAAVRKYNRELCALRVEQAPDPSWHYAWCTKCYAAKQHVARECSRQPPAVTGFVCDGCSVSKAEPKRLACPTCGVMTEKAWGCDHITCPSCSGHWCFACGYSGSDANDVYSHMWALHSNIGLQEAQPDEYVGEEEEEDAY